MEEASDLVDALLDLHELFQREHTLTIGGDGIGDASHGQVLDVRSFGAKRSHDPGGPALHLQGLKVVRHRHQVHFRRQLHLRMAPIAVGKHTQLA